MLANMLAAFGLVLLAVAGAESKCATAVYGSTVGVAVPLQDTTLSPGYADYSVQVPNVCVPPSKQVGTKLVACDPDVEPTVTLTDLNHGLVHRNGNYLLNTGDVHTTVYCA